ncbi:MAG: hypothetical protein FalmKO_19340 [Falsiruegeria mediterranea]|jgi:hypothetical protein
MVAEPIMPVMCAKMIPCADLLGLQMRADGFGLSQIVLEQNAPAPTFVDGKANTGHKHGDGDVENNVHAFKYGGDVVSRQVEGL